jgi:hypothetical protein
MILDHADEWGHFLHARKLIIDRFVQEQKSFPEIAIILSMDPMQVQLIAMTDVDPTRLAVPPGRSVTQEAEKPIERSHVADIAYDFCRYYVKGGGCSNCGGLPHADTCFVGRFIVALALDTLREPAVPPPALPTENMQGPAAHVFVDTPLKRAVRKAFDYPSITNIEAVADAAAPPALLALQQENEQLRDWKESALRELARTNVLHEALANRGEYLGWNVNEAIVDALQKTEAKLADALALVTRWEKESRGYDHDPAMAIRDCAAELRVQLERDT